MKKLLSVLALVLVLSLAIVGGVALAEEHQHVFDSWTFDDENAKLPTCTEKGYARVICSICGTPAEGEDAYVNKDPLGHDYQEDEDWTVSVAPTCTETGVKTKEVKCVRCGDVLKTLEAEIPAVGHVWGEELEVVPATEDDAHKTAATCTEAGTQDKAILCQVCGAIKEGTLVTVKTDAPLGHTEAAPVKENEVKATCIATGSHDEVVYCSVCHIELSRKEGIIDPTIDHVYPTTPTKENEKAATCEDYATWEEVIYCSVCGFEKPDSRVQKTGDKLGDHTWEKDPDHPYTIQPTCYKEGTGYYFCSVCGVKNPNETYKIPMVDHTYGEIKEVPATCIAKGGKIRECVNEFEVTDEEGNTVTEKCPETAKGHFEYVEVYEIDPNAHDWRYVDKNGKLEDGTDTNGSFSRDATCTKNGVEASYCVLCHARKAEEIPALGHDTVIIPAIAPTCEDVGYTAGLACKREGCDGKAVELPDGYPEENLPDDFDDYVLLTAPEEIEATGHVVLDIIEDTTSCTEDGYVKFKCSVCGKVVTEEVKALGHDYKLDGETEPANCIDGGYNTLICTRCGDELRIEIPATGAHEWGEYITEPATCKSAGRIYRICEVCGWEEEQEFLPLDPDAHDWYQDWSDVKVYPNCENNEDGLGLWVCAICGQKKYDVYPADHDPVAYPDIAPTCTENGMTGAVICVNCGEVLQEPIVIPALGHEYVDGVCIRCGEEEVIEEDPVKDFVARNYDLILSREVDETGLTYWADQLKDGSLSGAGLVNGIVISDEFKAKGMSAEDFVTTLYKAILGRKPDATGLAYWTGLLKTGVSESYIVNGFATSPEFKAICAEYGINAGSVTFDQSRDKNLNVTEFVSRNYTKALNRSGDAEGINYWCNKLLSKTMTPQQVAYGFVFSNESVKRNLSDSAFVEMLYNLYMGRSSDNTGKTYWVNSLTNGMTRQQVANQFAASPEFTAIVASYGL